MQWKSISLNITCLTTEWNIKVYVLKIEVYANPQNEYQVFINAFFRKNICGERRQIIKSTNIVWSTIKNDKEKIDEFISCNVFETPEAMQCLHNEIKNVAEFENSLY